VVGERGLKEGKFEYQGRRDSEATQVDIATMLDFLKAKLVA
jgi:prolyl-tRNA synthetase